MAREFRSRDERYRDAAEWLSRRGLRVERTPPETLERFLPWLFLPPDRCLVRAVGRCEDGQLELFEYEHQDSVGAARDYLVAALSHPRINGGARIAPDPLALTRGASRLIGAFLRRPRDHALGHREFDRRYLVSSASPEAAARAIPHALCELLAKARGWLTLDLRPGVVLYAGARAHFDAELLAPLLDLARPLLAAVLSPPQHPLR
jgi:hypothetical protein